MIIGAGGAIGSAFVRLLSMRPDTRRLHACSRRPIGTDHDKVIPHQLDLEDEDSIAAFASALAEEPLDLVIVASGMLHDASIQPEKSLRDLSASKFAKLFAVNTIGPALVIKHLLPKLNRGSRSVFAVLSARVGSIGDNRLGGWYAYRASKAALNMVLKNASIEIARTNRHAIVVGLHPGTVESRLSEPFRKSVKPEKLFSSEFSATQMLSVIDRLTVEDTGSVFAWDGTIITP